MNVKNGVNYDRPSEIKDGDSNVYRCERYLAKGGFSKVYQIKQNNLKVIYCGKFIPIEIGHRTYLNMRKEIQIHQCLKHENVLRFNKYVENESLCCLILEYCDNKSMSELIKRRSGLSVSEIRYYAKQILSGMKYLHYNNVIHRDIKPQNILINSNMIVKIADFGLATKVRWRGAKIKKNMIYGTPNYISPEMINPKISEYDYRVDVWAIGVLLYDMAVGRPPFLGNKIEDIHKNILTCNYEIPSDVCATLKSLIEKILKVCSYKRPDFECISRDAFLQGFCPKSMPKSALVEAPRFAANKKSADRSNQLNVAAVIVNSGIAINKFTNLSIKQSFSLKPKVNSFRTLPMSYCARKCIRHILRRMKNEFATIPTDTVLTEWNESELETPYLEPILWISELIQCKERFQCAAYKLNNGITGAMYPNKTAITILANDDIQYYTPATNSKYVWKPNNCPSLLTRKVDTLKSIYTMNTSISRKSGDDWLSLMPHLLYYEFRDDLAFVILSTGLYQMNVGKTGHKCLLCPKLRSFTHIDQDNVSTTFGLNAMRKQHGHPVGIHRSLSLMFRKLASLLSNDLCFICNKRVARRKLQ